jgi:RimJ/RimL family protein N-acetyltransferase
MTKKQDLLKELPANDVRIKPVSKSDYMFLYELLAERESTVNISHKKMPTFAEHVNFVMSKPYSKWYTVVVDNKKAGTVYLTRKNEVGIFIKKEFHGMKIGHRALKLLIQKNPRRTYYANINPENRKSIRFFKSNNFHPIQYTYELSRSQQKRN